jgi:hypothetical protein
MPNTITFKAEREAHALDALIEAGRTWLCGVPASMTDENIMVFIQAEYHGGLPQFAKDQNAECEIIWLLMVRRYGLDFANRIFWCA